MPSDRSRNSFEPKNGYRSVAFQQGRVLTDSDFNEAQDILAEEARRTAADVVGPSGTPDGGYGLGIYPDMGTNFGISAGTIYAGGIRVAMPPFAHYMQQPEWDWPVQVATPPPKELVWLDLFEQEISAVEDPTLLERALGGPDTAQRTRITQRIQRSPAPAAACADAFGALTSSWASQGWTYDAQTKRVLPDATMMLGFVNASAPAGPCEPAAQAGYLYTENQFIRVQLVSGTELVWSFDDASAIYRVEKVDDKTLTLASMPVDEQHWPRAGQVAELLRGVLPLTGGGIGADPIGKFVTIDTSFDPGNRTLALAESVSADFQIITNDFLSRKRPLYVRIWNARLPFVPHKPVELTGTGIQVTIDGGSSGALPAGAFWTLAARPGSPAEIYRKRDRTIPPDGPRRWAIPLGVIDWQITPGGKVVSDCREHFESLVALSNRQEPKKCCSVILSPADLTNGSFRSVLDAAKNVEGFKVCLLPGAYELHEPIVLTKEHKGIEFEACRDGVRIIGGSEATFADGVVQIDGSAGVTFRGIQFTVRVLPARGAGTMLPGVVVTGAAQTASNASTIQTARIAIGVGGGGTSLSVGAAIGIRAIDTPSLTVEHCQFVFPTAYDVRLLEFAGAAGAAILLYGQTNELTVRNNSFIGTTKTAQVVGRAAIVGVAMIPALVAPPGTDIYEPFLPNTFGQIDFNEIATLSNGGFLPNAVLPGTVLPVDTPAIDPNVLETASVDDEAARIATPASMPGTITVDPGPGEWPFPRPSEPGKMLPASLLGADISNNRFVGCAAAALLVGDTGFLRIIGNDVTEGTSGFVAVHSRWLPLLAFNGAGVVDQIFAQLAAGPLATLEQGQKWNAVQAIAETVAALTQPTLVWTATALLSLSLPDSIAARSGLVAVSGDVSYETFLQPLLDQAAGNFVAGKSVLNPPGTAEAANLGSAVRSRIASLWGSDAAPFGLLPNQRLWTMGFAGLLQQPPRAALALECTENVVNTRTGNGSALLVVAAPVTAENSSIVANNRFSNASVPVPAAVLALISRCIVTGNLVQNESVLHWASLAASKFWSLILVPGPRPTDDFSHLDDPIGPAPAPDPNPIANADAAIPAALTITLLPHRPEHAWVPPLTAITGNVFKGYPVLPPRFFPANGGPGDPFNTWLFVNTVSW